MKLNTHDKRHDSATPRLLESRTARSNLAVRHPPRWRLLRDLLISPTSRLHRYRTMSARLFEDAVDQHDFRHCRHE